MKLTYLGTAAAEGWPALFCTCPSCRSSNEHGGKSIRSRSQSLVNDDLLIDFPADSYWHIIANKMNLDLIENVIITHSHEDHLYIDDFANRTEGYIPKQYCPPFTLNLYGNDGVARLYNECCAIPYNQRLTEVVAMNEIFPFEAVSVGNYTVYPLPADHEPRERSYIYLIIEKDSKKALLYAHDTGYLKEECWKFLKDFKLDLVSLDCTFGRIKNCRNGHMGLDCAAEVKQRLIDEKIAKPETVFVINHFSHNGFFLNHEDIESEAKEYDFLVSYDGCEIEV